MENGDSSAVHRYADSDFSTETGDFAVVRLPTEVDHRGLYLTIYTNGPAFFRLNLTGT